MEKFLYPVWPFFVGIALFLGIFVFEVYLSEK